MRKPRHLLVIMVIALCVCILSACSSEDKASYDFKNMEFADPFKKADDFEEVSELVKEYFILFTKYVDESDKVTLNSFSEKYEDQMLEISTKLAVYQENDDESGENQLANELIMTYPKLGDFLINSKRTLLETSSTQEEIDDWITKTVNFVGLVYDAYTPELAESAQSQ